MDADLFNNLLLSEKSPCSTGNSCLDNDVVKVLRDITVSKSTDETTILSLLQQQTKCGDLTCALKNAAEKNNVIQDKLPIIFAKLKPRGPLNNTDLLSNFDIDAVLSRWAAEFRGFYNCEYSMIDFYKVNNKFATLSLPRIMAGLESLNVGPHSQNVKRPSDCFACVLNTDVSSGPGKHWVAVFVDCRPSLGNPWSVEYFNSTGNAPCKNVIKWMEETRVALESYRKLCCTSGTASDAVHSGIPDSIDGSKIDPNTADLRKVIALPVSSVSHQKSQTECGLYSLYYIRKRLVGTPYTFFQDYKVPDSEMIKFRKYVFRQ
jgi:hypothetical protein